MLTNNLYENPKKNVYSHTNTEVCDIPWTTLLIYLYIITLNVCIFHGPVYIKYDQFGYVRWVMILYVIILKKAYHIFLLLCRLLLLEFWTLVLYNVLTSSVLHSERETILFFYISCFLCFYLEAKNLLQLHPSCGRMSHGTIVYFLIWWSSSR